jgi:hypothetical protein
MSDNTMITVYPFDGSLYSFYESPYVYRIEPNSLETQGLMDLGKLGLISHSRYNFKKSLISLVLTNFRRDPKKVFYKLIHAY